MSLLLQSNPHFKLKLDYEISFLASPSSNASPKTSLSMIHSRVQRRHPHLYVTPGCHRLILFRIVLAPTSRQRLNHSLRVRSREKGNTVSRFTYISILLQCLASPFRIPRWCHNSVYSTPPSPITPSLHQISYIDKDGVWNRRYGDE